MWWGLHEKTGPWLTGQRRCVKPHASYGYGFVGVFVHLAFALFVHLLCIFHCCWFGDAAESWKKTPTVFDLVIIFQNTRHPRPLWKWTRGSAFISAGGDAVALACLPCCCRGGHRQECGDNDARQTCAARPIVSSQSVRLKACLGRYRGPGTSFEACTAVASLRVRLVVLLYRCC